MTTADATALREYVASRPPAPAFKGSRVGVMEFARTGQLLYITHADQHIAVTLDLVAVADETWFGFDAGVMTFRAINGTMQYRVIGLGRAWPREVVACERIEAADGVILLERAGGGEIRRDGDQITITRTAEVDDA